MNEFILKLTEAEVNIVLGALGQVQYVQVFNLINNLQTQINAQLKPKQSEYHGEELPE